MKAKGEKVLKNEDGIFEITMPSGERKLLD